jgi:hypothetical protein
MRFVGVAHSHQRLVVDIDIGTATCRIARRKMAGMTRSDVFSSMCWRHGPNLSRQLSESGNSRHSYERLHVFPDVSRSKHGCVSMNCHTKPRSSFPSAKVAGIATADRFMSGPFKTPKTRSRHGTARTTSNPLDIVVRYPTADPVAACVSPRMHLVPSATA